MLNGAEIPFRRSRRWNTTGSLIFDRHHDAYLRDARKHGEMRIWSQGHFVRS